MAIYEAGDVVTISAKSSSVTVLLRGSALLEVAGASKRATSGAPRTLPSGNHMYMAEAEHFYMQGSSSTDMCKLPKWRSQ